MKSQSNDMSAKEMARLREESRAEIEKQKKAVEAARQAHEEALREQ
jgi:hypothetical protein